jgi:hypothetical protein
MATTFSYTTPTRYGGLRPTSAFPGGVVGTGTQIPGVIDPTATSEDPAQTQLLNEQARLDAQAAQDAANATAETARGAANTAEADAYRIAAGTAGGNADMELQAAALTAFQQAREVRKTVGSQLAEVASNGFRESGTSLNLLRDSVSQGAITDALTKLQGNITAAGYRGQQAAATAEGLAATGNAGSATALAAQYAAAGVLATSQSANLAKTIATTPPPATGGGGSGLRVVPSKPDPFLTGGLVNPAFDPNAMVTPPEGPTDTSAFDTATPAQQNHTPLSGGSAAAEATAAAGGGVSDAPANPVSDTASSNSDQ